jgi:hypothetical protein
LNGILAQHDLYTGVRKVVLRNIINETEFMMDNLHSYLLELLRRVGFAHVELLHNNKCFAAFGAWKE